MKTIKIIKIIDIEVLKFEKNGIFEDNVFLNLELENNKYLKNGKFLISKIDGLNLLEKNGYILELSNKKDIDKLKKIKSQKIENKEINYIQYNNLNTLEQVKQEESKTIEYKIPEYICNKETSFAELKSDLSMHFKVELLESDKINIAKKTLIKKLNKKEQEVIAFGKLFDNHILTNNNIELFSNLENFKNKEEILDNMNEKDQALLIEMLNYNRNNETFFVFDYFETIKIYNVIIFDIFLSKYVIYNLSDLLSFDSLKVKDFPLLYELSMFNKQIRKINNF